MTSWSDDDLLAQFPADARPEVMAIAEAAAIAARETFGPFNDHEASEFFQAEGLSPEATWERAAEKLALAGARVVVLALSGADAERDLICNVHGDVFADLFPRVGGQLRTDADPVEYGIVIGRRDQPVHRVARGTRGGQIAPRLDEACEEFNEAVRVEDAKEASELSALIAPAVKLYCKTLSIHPFIDGNGRTAFLLLQFALVRVGLLCVALPDYEEHQWALGAALRTDGKQTYLEMERLIADKLSTARFDT